MEYLLKANGIVVILLLFYYTFLKNETFFKSIRSYFIVGLLAVLIIPLIEIPIYVKTVISQINLTDFAKISTSEVATYSIDWQQIIFILYAVGVVFFSLKFLVQLISLGLLISKHPIVKHENYYFIETLKNVLPFSFFNIIVYNKNQFSINELQHIINHEKAHVQQWHSIDVILSHLLVITLWFNPFVWLYKKAAQQNLEFLADSYALELTDNQKLYQLTLLKTSGANYYTEITNSFYNSLLKKRIIMLHKNRSTTKSKWKYALLLPILVLFIVTFNTKVIAQEKKLLETEQLTNLKIELIIDKNSTDENLNEEASFFKKEFDIALTFKGIKRNNNGEITAIKIDAKGNNL
ncbi:M56 family metallopeptidase [Lutibacter sp.]